MMRAPQPVQPPPGPLQRPDKISALHRAHYTHQGAAPVNSDGNHVPAG
jgi:hypothetical protein